MTTGDAITANAVLASARADRDWSGRRRRFSCRRFSRL